MRKLTITYLVLLILTTLLVACNSETPTPALATQESEEVVVEPTVEPTAAEPTKTVGEAAPTQDALTTEVAPTATAQPDNGYPGAAPTATVVVHDPGYPVPENPPTVISDNGYPGPDATSASPQKTATPKATIAATASGTTPTATKAATVEGVTYKIETKSSNASYTVDEEFFSGAVSNLGKQLGFFTPVGVTEQVAGEIILNMDSNPPQVGGEIVVDISLLTSDDQRRDQKIRTDFLESSIFPQATFVPKKITGFPASYTNGQQVTFKLQGDLTIRNVTKTVTFDVTAKLLGDTLSGTATATILMTDFGFDPPAISGFMQAENDVLLTIKLVAKK